MYYRYLLAGFLMIMSVNSVAADEGMWLLNDPPRSQLQDKYQFDLTDPWLARVMRAAVRFNNGGSGGFVSPRGLVITNHHIGADALQKLSTAERDLIKNGYLAHKPDEELKCPDLELNVLRSIEDVTAKVEGAISPELTAADAAAKRRATIAAIEKESMEKTGLRSDVVTLYQGGLYHLYRYKKYTDVRLVFAPESIAAAFGGDVDNFEFPRFGFDVCFFRVYEDGAAIKSPHYFPWAEKSPAEGDLVFVAGHPGTTNRLETVSKLLYRRDRGHPYTLARLRALEAALSQFSERGPDERLMAATDLHRLANARKALSGQFQGLLDENILKQKLEEEKQVKSKYQGKPIPWMQIANAQSKLASIDVDYYFWERGDGYFSDLFTIARHLVRLAEELKKPNGERLREYRDSALDSLKLQLFSPAPIHPQLERAKLMASLTFMAERLGGEHILVQMSLGGKSPETRANELIANCKLFDPKERQKLFDGGTDAIANSTDPMIQLVRTIDVRAQEIRKTFENEVEEPERQGYAKIAKARFAAFGKAIAPDATFTLRLAFGRVQGYEADGQSIPFFTTIGGLFEKAEKQQHREPFVVAASWQSARSKLSPTTAMNFVSTADTIGGNSGSPVINRAGQLVGVNFDRNRFGLIRNFVYTDVQARHISVHGAAVIEALNKVYGATELLAELRDSK